MKILKSMILWLIAIFYIFPLLILFTNSFMSGKEIERNYSQNYSSLATDLEKKFHYAEYNLIPDKVSFEQYNNILFKTPMYLNLFFNSVKLTLPIVFFQIVVGTMGAYGFMSCRFKFKNILLFLYIIVMVMPYQATLVPNYLIASKLGILNNYLSIILPSIFSPFAVFIIYQGIKTIPKDIFFAAQIDGASHFICFIKIAVPLLKGSIASLFILSFVDYWSMIEQPMVFIKDITKEPLSIFLSRIGQDEVGIIFAASLFYMIPAIWIFLYGQEYFVEGIKLSAIK